MFKHLWLTAAVCAVSALTSLAQNRYLYTVDIVNIKNDQVAVALQVPALTQQSVIFSFPKAIPGSYARKDFGRFIDDFTALDKSGKKVKVEKLGANQYRIANAGNLDRITYKVNDTWDHKHADFIFQPGGSNIEAGTNVVMNNHAFFGYFEGLTKLPVEVNINKPFEFFAATNLPVEHPLAGLDVIKATDYVQLADNPIIYAKPDTTSFYQGKSKINIAVYSATGKVKSEKVAGYLKPLAAALDKFFNGLPVKSYQFLYYFEDPQRALTNRNKGEGGYGALEHNYSSLYYLPEVPFEKDLISMINDVSTHEFLHIQTPLNLHSYEIENFNFTDPAMSQHLWLYEGVTEYFAQLVQLQNGLITEKKFFEEMRSKMNQAEEFGDFSMTEMSRRVMEDSYQKKYNSVYSRGALIGLMLDVYIREKTNGAKDLKQVITTLAKKYGPSRPFEDNQLFADFIAASHPDVKQFIDSYIVGAEPLPYQAYFAKLGYEYAGAKKVQAFYPGRVGIKFVEADNAFVFANVEGNPLDIKDGDVLKKIDGVAVTPDNINEVWENYFNMNTQHPEIAITVLRNGQEKVLQGKILDGQFDAKNYLAPVAGASPQQQQMLKRLSAKS